MKTFLLFWLLFFGFHLYAVNSELIHQSRLSVRKLKNRRSVGTGFTVLEDNTMVTNYHVILGLLRYGTLEDIQIVQDKEPGSLKIKGLRAVSGLADLALLEIDGYLPPLSLIPAEDLVTKGKEVFIPGYPKGGFRIMKKTGPSSQLSSIEESFAVNNVTMNGASGSPVLVEIQGELVVSGVFSKGTFNFIVSVHGATLKSFLEGDIGTRCLNDNPRECFKKEIGSLHNQAKRGDAAAQNALAVMYAKALGVEQSDETAALWYERAAEQDHALAQNDLALMYEKGLGVEQSDETAARWFERAAEQGLAPAQYNLGLMYEEGQGVEQSYEKAVLWYERAAEQGYVVAQNNLAFMYYDGGQGVEQSDETAALWYERAAEQGYASAQHNLAFMYAEGLGVEQSYEKAALWYESAAEQGYASAQNNLAFMYAEGLGVEQSYEKAVLWSERAAEQGYAVAQYNLAIMYEEGQGVEQSYEKAALWYESAAEQGHASAQNNLAFMYAEGLGVEQSYEKAARWYERAAEQGYIK